MKKFMQSCAVTALILFVSGLAMMLIAGAFKGKEVLKNVAEYITEAIDNGISEDMRVQYALENFTIYDNTLDILNGDVEMYSVGSDISEMDIEVGGCTFDVKLSKDYDYYLEAENVGKFQGHVKDGTLYIKGTVGTGVIAGQDECKITLYVPVDWEEHILNKVDMEIGAGVVEMEGIVADKVQLEVGAGQIKTSRIIADTLEVSVGMGEILAEDIQVEQLVGEVDMGHLYIEGAVNEKADVECAMGSLEMVIDGAQNDFDYEIECGMGNIDLGENSYSGVAQERTISNNASKKMIVECAMGEVDISFVE